MGCKSGYGFEPHPNHNLNTGGSRDDYLDDDFFDLGGGGNAQLGHGAVLGVEDGEVAGAKGEG